MIYLDSCALAKLVIAEPESQALKGHLAERLRKGHRCFTSELAAVEVHRALWRQDARQEAHERADLVLAGFAALPVSPMLDDAAKFPFPHLRTLDAVQLASAY